MWASSQTAMQSLLLRGAWALMSLAPVIGEGHGAWTCWRGIQDQPCPLSVFWGDLSSCSNFGTQLTAGSASYVICFCF